MRYKRPSPMTKTLSSFGLISYFDGRGMAKASEPGRINTYDHVPVITVVCWLR